MEEKYSNVEHQKPVGKMSKEEIQKLVDIRMMLLENFNNKKDWKNNRNAIMREIDHVEIMEKTIKQIDAILSSYVNFS